MVIWNVPKINIKVTEGHSITNGKSDAIIAKYTAVKMPIEEHMVNCIFGMDHTCLEGFKNQMFL